MKVNYIYDKGILNEALMTSYPIIASGDDKAGAASVLKKNFKTVTYIEKMDRSPYWISDTEEHEKGNTTYKIYIKDPSEVDALSDFCDKSLGWLTIGIGVEEPDYETYIDGTEVLIFTKRMADGKYRCNVLGDMEFSKYYEHSLSRIQSIFLVIEAKYTKETKDFERLFHITHVKFLPKIKEHGLVPKTNGTQTERVYFSRRIEDSMKMLRGSFDKNDEPWVLALWMDKFGDEIKSRYKFYEDPREDGAVYTYDTIDPKYIIIKLKNGSWYMLDDIDIDSIKNQLEYYYRNK